MTETFTYDVLKYGEYGIIVLENRPETFTYDVFKLRQKDDTSKKNNIIYKVVILYESNDIG